MVLIKYLMVQKGKKLRQKKFFGNFGLDHSIRDEKNVGIKQDLKPSNVCFWKDELRE
jgi:hypothetical protein